MDDSAAKENDLRINDLILSVNNIQIDEFSDIPKALGNDNFISLLLDRDGQLIEKNFELKFNNEINRYVIGISTNSDPIIDKFNFNKSIQNSLIFIPTYYGASLRTL